MNWRAIAVQTGLSEEFIREHKDYLEWFGISMRQTLSEEFIEEMKDYVKWDFIFRHQTLSENFIDRHQDKDIWLSVFKYQPLSLAYVRKKYDLIEQKQLWIKLSENPFLTADVMEAYQDKLYFASISFHAKLDKHVLRKFQHQLDWTAISEFQALSFSDVKSFFSYIHLDRLRLNQKVSFSEEEWSLLERMKEHA